MVCLAVPLREQMSWVGVDGGRMVTSLAFLGIKTHTLLPSGGGVAACRKEHPLLQSCERGLFSISVPGKTMLRPQRLAAAPLPLAAALMQSV